MSVFDGNAMVLKIETAISAGVPTLNDNYFAYASMMDQLRAQHTWSPVTSSQAPCVGIPLAAALQITFISA